MKKSGLTHFLTILLITGFIGCSKESGNKLNPNQREAKMDIQKQIFGKLPDGRDVEIYTLSNRNHMKARFMTYGATLVSLTVPDRRGKREDIILGHDSLQGYLKASPYFGATVGRYANRIAHGQFQLNGQEYQLPTNEGEHHLHGGEKGFDQRLWKAEVTKGQDAVGVRFHYLSQDGEEGYPGNLSCQVTYILTQSNQIKISYWAETDEPTPVNLTHHSYFNLKGHEKGNILDHKLMINASQYTPVGEDLIPTGEICSVRKTPLDFTSPQKIGSRIGQIEGGYDHNYVLNKENNELSLAARVAELQSGRVMEIHTTEPGIQFYSGNFLDGTITGKDGRVYPKHAGFCLEPQHYPDSPNHSNFPSTILRPGEEYQSLSVYKFYTR